MADQWLKVSVKRIHWAMAFQKVDRSAQLSTLVAPQSELVEPSYLPGTFMNLGLKAGKKNSILVDSFEHQKLSSWKEEEMDAKMEMDDFLGCC